MRPAESSGRVPGGSMNKRRTPRAKKRMTCRLYCDGKRHSGLVLDISANGLFVQTSAAPSPGGSVQLDLQLPGQAQPVRLEGRAARCRVVPARLRAVAQGGIGIELSNAPETYFTLVAEALREKVTPEEAPQEARPRRKATSLERRARKLALEHVLGGRKAPAKPPEPEAPKPDPPTARTSYRVRVKLGPRRQTLLVEAGSEEEARKKARVEAGDGWRVLRCEPA